MSELPFFLTDWAEAKLGGGRDPLGLQIVWSKLARQGLQGINSVCGDLTGWRTLLIGAAIAHELKDEPKKVILSFERLAAYSKFAAAHANPKKNSHLTKGIRGKNALDRYPDYGWENIYVSAKDKTTPVLRLLSNQENTGVKGQISGAAMHLGILTSELRLTSIGQELWDILKCQTDITTHLHLLKTWLCEGVPIDDTLETLVIQLTGFTFSCKKEQDWYIKYVLRAEYLKRSSQKPKGWTSSHQEYLSIVFHTYKRDELFLSNNIVNIDKLGNKVSSLTLSDGTITTDDCVQWLNNIGEIEQILGLADKVFLWMLFVLRDVHTLDELVDMMKQSDFTILPLTSMDPNGRSYRILQEIVCEAYPKGKNQKSSIARKILSLVSCSSFKEYIQTLIDLNILVSKQRGKLEWLKKQDQGYLCWKHYQISSKHSLPQNTPLNYWYHSYYFPQFYSLVTETYKGWSS